MRRDRFGLRVHQVPVEGRVVEAQLPLERSVHRGGVAGVGVGVGGPDGDVAVSVPPAEVFVKEGVGHEPVDPREAPVGQRKLADPFRAPVHRKLADGERLAGFGVDLDGVPLFKGQFHPLDVVAAPVGGEVRIVGPFGAAPVRGDEDLETGDVMAGYPRPFPLHARRDPEVAMGGFDVETGRLQPSQPLLDGGRIASDLLPFGDRISAVQITCLDDLFGVSLRRRPGLRRKLRRRQCAEGPAVAPLLLAPFEDVTERLAGDQGLADPGRVDLFEMGQRIGCMEVDPPVEISAEFLLSRGLENELASAGLPEERPFHADGEPHPLNRVHPRGDYPVIENLGETEGGAVVLDED